MSGGAASPWRSVDEREQDKAQKREAVLQAAVRAFNERGFHATSLDDVAAGLGVTKPTIYHYFANKDEILFECARRGLDSIRAAAEGVARSGGTGAARLEALMRDYALVMTQDFGMCVIRTADHELSVQSRLALRRLKREIDETVRGVIEDGIADGSLAACDSRMASFALTGALNWIARWFDPFGARSPDEIAAHCVAVLMNGMLPRAIEDSEKGQSA